MDYTPNGFQHPNRMRHSPDGMPPPMHPRKPQGSAMPLAMAWFEDQALGEIYAPDKALAAGTLFPELDKPWLVRNGGR